MVELSKVERLMLVNQYRILAALIPDEDNSRVLEILEHGYESEYFIDNVILDPLPLEECRLVIGALSMYERLQRAVTGLSLGEAVPATFPGFDGNHETSHLTFAEHLVEVQGRFRQVHVHRTERGLDLNSHDPMVPRYRAMLAAMPQTSKELDEETVRTVLAVRPEDD